jgi:hypothetical protein
VATQTFTVVYTFELDTGDVPAEAVAEMLKANDVGTSDYNVWEVAGATMTLRRIEVGDGS